MHDNVMHWQTEQMVSYLKTTDRIAVVLLRSCTNKTFIQILCTISHLHALPTPTYGNSWGMAPLMQCSPMAVGPSDISGNDWLGPINSSPAADRMSDEIFGANLVSLGEI